VQSSRHGNGTGPHPGGFQNDRNTAIGHLHWKPSDIVRWDFVFQIKGPQLPRIPHLVFDPCDLRGDENHLGQSSGGGLNSPASRMASTNIFVALGGNPLFDIANPLRDGTRAPKGIIKQLD
jgi:hypothetical protein